MNNLVFYILPNQLFDVKYIIDAINEYFVETNTNQGNILFNVWEHPHYFTRYRFNKKKLVLHRASMQYYFKEVLPDVEHSLKDYKIELNYITYNTTYKLKYDNKQLYNASFDTIDCIKNFSSKMDIQFESPNFLLTKNDYLEYRKGRSQKSGFSFTTGFYKFGKSKIKFLENINSLDHENRDKLDEHNTNNIPILNINDYIDNTELKYIKEAKTYVNANFSDNYGSIEDDFYFPISQKSANKLFTDFLKNRLTDFGKYQDAIIKDNFVLYHSLLSSSLNIGIINPIEIIDILRSKYKKYPLNSVEGYVRQLFWREFQRYCYIHAKTLLSKPTLFKFRKRLTKKWYDGDTGIEPIDNCINRAFNNAYLHHIERLMLMGNFMVLNEISPKQGFKWFMEFAIDSYDWVMYQNVYDMVFFNTGGMTSRKPYITSSNYILNMSNYSKNDEWVTKWDRLYDSFLKKHKKKLWKFRYHFPSLKKID